jgi:hypothetical protein
VQSRAGVILGGEGCSGLAACTLAFPSLLMPDARSYFRPLAHQALRKAKSRSSHPTPSRHSQKFPFKPPLCKQTCAWGAFVNTNKPYSRPLGVSRAHLASGCSSGRSFQIHSMNPMAASTSRCNSSIIREPCAGGLEAGMERQHASLSLAAGLLNNSSPRRSDAT